MDIVTMLKRDEGFSRFVYRDSVGKATIGFGRNLEDNGICEEEAMLMLQNDLKHVEKDLMIAFPTYQFLDALRQMALQNMVYNLGIVRFLQFRKMIAALEARDYLLAAKEMLTSKWSAQVGMRAQRLAFIVEHGYLPEGY